jgi:hypothetical protein
MIDIMKKMEIILKIHFHPVLLPLLNDTLLLKELLHRVAVDGAH